jgi:hypothetical protein
LERIMRKSIKSGIVATAIAASALGAGAGLAAVAGPASAATVSATAAVVPNQNPALNAWNRMNVVLNGTTFTGYWVLLQTHRGGLLTGWLYDPNLPTAQRYLAVHGSVSGGVVVFAASYPAGDPQGVRAFVGTIGSGGVGLSGNWTETGSEQGHGTFTFV